MYIKSEDIDKLFAEFERIEEFRNRNIEGTGLGMAITTKLLDMMGSTLKVESEYGVGSEFYFDIEQPIVNEEPIGNIAERISQMVDEYIYEVRCFVNGAQDFISKPFAADVVLQRVNRTLELNRLKKDMQKQVEVQTAIATQRLRTIELLTDEVINAMAAAIDAKDKYTNGHSMRVAIYATKLADYYNVSVDYLLNRTSKRELYK